MPFEELPEGQTHYENDNCGEPEHNENIVNCKDCLAHYSKGFLHTCPPLMRFLVKTYKEKKEIDS